MSQRSPIAMLRRSSGHRMGGAVVGLVALMLVMGAVIVFMALGGARQQELSNQGLSATRSFYAAESGVNMAVREVLMNVDHDNNGVGTIESSQSMLSALHGSMIDVQASTLGNTVTLSGKGVHVDSRHAVQATLQLGSAGGAGFLLPYGVAVSTQITMSGAARIDALDSAVDVYNEHSNANGHAAIGTNSTSNGHITMSGSSLIHGDVFVGPNGNPDSVIKTSGSATPGYTQSPMNEAYELAEVPEPSNLPATQGDKTFPNHGSSTITAGSYQFKTFTVSNNFTVYIDGDVLIYCTDEFKLSNAGRILLNEGATFTIYAKKYSLSNNSKINYVSGNVATNPSSVTIYQTGSDKIVLENSATIVGSIIAPNAEVNIKNNANLFGAIQAESLTIENSGRFTQDLAMTSGALGGGGGGSGSGSLVVTWTQVSPSN